MASGRQYSLRALERLIDIAMMMLFALLGVLLTVIGATQASVLSIIGGILVVLTVVPLWLGGRTPPGRHRRDLRWYPVALVLLAIGLLVWVHPWTL